MKPDPTEKPKFLHWYKKRAKKLGLNPNPWDENQKYNYEGAFKEGAEPDKTGHWPSKFKHDDHPNRFIKQPDGSILDSKNDRKVKVKKK